MKARQPTQRQLRVGEEVRHALAQVLQRGDLRDPALVGVSVTVSEVRLSPDLKNATCYVTPLGASTQAAPAADQMEKEVVDALRRASAFLRGQVARDVRLRYMPALRFKIDETFDEAARIDDLLNKPEVRRDLEAAAYDDDEDGPDEDGPDEAAPKSGDA